MVWYFSGVYIINTHRTLHGCLETQNFSSRIEKNISLIRAIFQHSKRNFVSPCSHVISPIYYINANEIPSELLRENLISSEVKVTCYLHM